MSRVESGTVFIVDRRTPEFEAVFPQPVRDRLAAAVGVDSVPVLNRRDLFDGDGSLESVETVFSTWSMPVLTRSEIDKLFPKLKHVFYAAGSVKYFAGPYLDSGVRVFSASKVNARPVAEYAFAQIVLANKGYYRARISPMLDFFRARRRSSQFPGNHQIAIGILGLGQIGKIVASELHDLLDCDIKVYDPYVSQDECDVFGAKKATLREVFAECSVISNHMPDIPETRGILNRELFNLMLPTATFVNTARGAQVVEKDLLATLRRNPLQTALLDVTSDGVVRPWNPLVWRNNVYLTPHIAGSTGNEQARMGEAMVRQFELLDGPRPNDFEVYAPDLERGA